MKSFAFYTVVLCSILCSYCAASTVHTCQKVEITLTSENSYNNPYTDVDLWVQLKGPNFDKKVYGFWDGANTFKIRVMATQPGTWTWVSFSSTEDPGLSGKTGQFKAIPWTENEKQANPNRRGTVRPTPNNRALQYADGTPFFLLSDTHWSAGTWRYPFKGQKVTKDFKPGPGMGFEETIELLKNKGFNSIGMIACFPNWDHDQYNKNLKDDAGIQIRAAWPKPGNEEKAMDMHDEKGNRPFEFPGKTIACANFDRINPAYFQSLDKKMDYMTANGFVPYFESIRRDHFASWVAYYDFDESFGRYLKYLRARYGTNNMIYSLFHGDYIGKSSWLKPLERAVDLYYQKYGPMPFGLPTTAMANRATLLYFGHKDRSPWLELHTSGNFYRHHKIYGWIEKQFNLEDPVPVFNNEPYYVGFKKPLVDGKLPPINSPTDNYNARSMMYGCVLSGSLAGHVYGSISWPGITTGESQYAKSESRRGKHFWQPFEYDAHGQMRYLGKFILSEPKLYPNLLLADNDLEPAKSPGAPEVGFEGWAHMMRTKNKKLALLYFEKNCDKAVLSNMLPHQTYKAQWYDTRKGTWSDVGNGKIRSDSQGKITMPNFPSGSPRSENDWALKLKAAN